MKGTETPPVYSIEGIPLKAGAVSWSPDSTRLAFIRNGQLVLFDYATGKSRRVPEIKPVFLDWAPGERLAVVRDTGAGREIITLDAEKGTYQSVKSDNNTEAVRWLNQHDTLVALSTDIKRRTIGTFVNYVLTRIEGGRQERVYEREFYFPTHRQDLEFISGWSVPGIRPVYETVLAPEYHNPPAVSPYTYFRTVDPVTGMEEEIMKLDSRRINVLSSWSPDGSRFAVTDDEGLLIIIDASEHAGVAAGISMTVNYDIKGLHPSWNPKGSQIYLGGWLIRSDGEAIRRLLADAVNSISVWSPDGERLAVLTGHGMVLFDSIQPSFHPPDRPLDRGLIEKREKFRILKDLLIEGLITDLEFHTRRTKLFESAEERAK